jgi:putative ABC transport system permease protein
MSRGVRALFLAVVLRPLLREKLRSVLTIGGIAIGIAVIVAVQLANQSAIRAFTESIDAVAGRSTHQVLTDAGTFDERFLLSLQPLWREGLRFAPVIDLDATLEPDRQPIRILAVDLFSDLHFRDYRYTRIAAAPSEQRPPGLRGESEADEWSLPTFLTLFRDRSIILPQQLARRRGLTVGDSVMVSLGGRSERLILRGTLEPIGPAAAFDGSIAILDISVAQQVFGLGGRINRVDLIVPPAAAAAVLDSIRINLPPNARIERPSQRNERVLRMLRAFRVNLYALAAISLLVGIFLVYNTLLVSVLRRRREIGIATTLGASRRQVALVFMLEGAAFGLIGSLAGLLLGYGLAFGALETIGRTIGTLYLPTAPTELVLSPLSIVTALVLGVGVSIAAALHPAREAASAQPNQMIRSGLYQRVPAGSDRRLALLAIGCMLLSAAATRLAPIGGISIGGYTSVLFLLAGFTLIVPMVLSGSARLAGRRLRWTSGGSDQSLPGRHFPAARLGAAAVPASLRRTSIAAAALMIAIAMTVAVAVMVGSFRQTVDAWVDQTIGSDLWIRPARDLSTGAQAAFPPEAAEPLRTMPGVAAFDRVRAIELPYADTAITVVGADFAVAMRYSRLPMIRPSSPVTALQEAVRQDGVVITESLSFHHDLTVGDELTLNTIEGPTSFTITGVYRDYSSDRGVAVIDRELFIRRFGDDSINTISVYLDPEADLETLRAEIERRLGPEFGAFTIPNALIRAEVMRIFDQTFMITWALLAIALVVAVTGIVNTLSALILERRRELALLRVLGMRSREVGTMIVVESAFIGLTAAILGLLCGLILSLILIYVINRQSFGWTIELAPPWTLIAVAVTLSFFTALLAGLIPARLTRRIDLATAVKAE